VDLIILLVFLLATIGGAIAVFQSNFRSGEAWFAFFVALGFLLIQFQATKF
jgi:hypothetical protein